MESVSEERGGKEWNSTDLTDDLVVREHLASEA